MARNRNPIPCAQIFYFRAHARSGRADLGPPLRRDDVRARLGDFRAAGAFRRPRAARGPGSLVEPSSAAPAATPATKAKAASTAHLSQLLNRLAGQLSPRSRIWDPLPTEFFDDRPDPALQVRGGILD